jgi:hypothetical protein
MPTPFPEALIAGMCAGIALTIAAIVRAHLARRSANLRALDAAWRRRRALESRIGLHRLHDEHAARVRGDHGGGA